MGIVASSRKLRNDNMKTPYSRRAHHAGSWYGSDREELDKMLDKFLDDAANLGSGVVPSADDVENSSVDSESGNERGKTPSGVPRACISPHAGFHYSGQTAAYSYLALKEALLKNSSLRTVVVIHPSHHVHLNGCAVSGASVVETPLGNLPVDESLREKILSTGKFEVMERGTDEREHSGEMQYPYIAKIINDIAKNNIGKSKGIVKVLPIMVGSIKSTVEKEFGKLLSSHLSDPGIFTVISSDFCHWGRRFNYMPKPSQLDKAVNEVYEYIEYLDRKGMDLIELQRPGAFADYLREYSNTICGRHPIGVWLNAITANSEEGAEHLDVRFVKYAQSGKVKSSQEESVSYASAVARLVTKN